MSFITLIRKSRWSAEKLLLSLLHGFKSTSSTADSHTDTDLELVIYPLSFKQIFAYRRAVSTTDLRPCEQNASNLRVVQRTINIIHSAISTAVEPLVSPYTSG